MVTKYKANESFSKHMSISNMQEAGDDLNLGEDEEDVLVIDKDNDFFNFLQQIIKEDVAAELKVHDEEYQQSAYQTSYGLCKRPFGILRTRVVEFLADAFKVFFRDIQATFVESDIFNTLLFYFDMYPYHNVMHMKVNEIIMLALEKNSDALINHFLYQTCLIKKILDNSMDGGLYRFQSTGLTLNKGYIAFMRKIGNKLADLQKTNEEVANFLDSIPEWSDYYQNDLQAANAIESKPLASDPRQKITNDTDDYFDFICKIKNIGGKSTGTNNEQDQNNEQ